MSVTLPNPSSPPFNIGTHQFYSDVQYGYDSGRQKMDIFNSSIPGPEPHNLRPCVILCHGGGFTGGDKSDTYSSSGQRNMIKQLLDRGVVVAAINYPLLDDPNNVEGLLYCVRSAGRSVQFLKFSQLNIDPERVLMMGSSAGGSIALWVGVSPDMSTYGFPEDPISVVSSKLHAIIATSVQATLDVVKWEQVFLSYGWQVSAIGSKCDDYYHEPNFYTPMATTRRAWVDSLAHISANSPEIWAGSSVPNVAPDTTSILFHHPLHIKALKDQYTALGRSGKFEAPALGISSDESMTQFLLRKISD